MVTNFTLVESKLDQVEQSVDLRKFYSISVLILITYSALAFLVNTGILTTIFFVKRPLNPTLKLTVSLTLSDMFTTATIAFSLLFNSYLPYVLGIMVTNACLALTAEALRMGGFFSGIFHLLALAFNHYMSTVHPFVARKMMKPTTINLIIPLLWVFPIASMLIAFGSVRQQGYRTPNGTCANLEFNTSFEYRMIVLTVICSLLAVMSALYASVIVILNRMKMKFAITNIVPCGNQQQRLLKRKRKTLATTLWICGTFFFGWFPTSLFFFLMCRECPFNATNKHTMVYVFGFLSNFFILTKTLANPIIYATRVPEIKSVLHKWKSCRKSAPSRTPSGRTRYDDNVVLRSYNNNIILD